MSTPWPRLPGRAVIGLLEPGPIALGPTPMTPTTPLGSQYWPNEVGNADKLVGQEKMGTLYAAEGVPTPLPKSTGPWNVR